MLVDKFLEDATEVDVDCIADVGQFADPAEGTIVIGGMLEHIEFAGVHSGDAAMVLPPHTLSQQVIQTIREYTHAMARELKVIGLMNVQYAVKGDDGLCAGGQSARLAHGAVRQQGHRRAAGQAGRQGHGRQDARRSWGSPRKSGRKYWAVKESVFPFNRFHGQDILLSPEMRSTGEVMGLDADLGIAYAKSQMAAGAPLPISGRVFISVSDAHKDERGRGGQAVCRPGLRADRHQRHRRRCWKRPASRCSASSSCTEGRPNTIDLLKNREIQLVINTPAGQTPRADEVKIRTTAVYTGTPIMTTLSGAKAAALGIAALRSSGYGVKTLQEYH